MAILTTLYTPNPFPVIFRSPVGGQNCAHQASSLSVSDPQWEDKIAHTKPVPCQCQIPSRRTKLHTPNKFPANVSSLLARWRQHCTHQTNSLSVSVPQWEDKITHNKPVPCQCQFPNGRTKLHTPNKFPVSVSSPVGGQNCSHQTSSLPMSVPQWGDKIVHQTSSQPMSVPCWPDEDSTAHTKPIPCQCQFLGGQEGTGPMASLCGEEESLLRNRQSSL